jgi:hypothetical protein
MTPMDYHTLTNESLAMMYFGARGRWLLTTN